MPCRYATSKALSLWVKQSLSNPIVFAISFQGEVPICRLIVACYFSFCENSSRELAGYTTLFHAGMAYYTQFCNRYLLGYPFVLDVAYKFPCSRKV